MSTYEELLEESRFKIQSFLDSTANEYVPNMFWALHNDNPDLEPEDVKDRIEKDCVGIWSKCTLSDALPDEVKDSKKQKARRLRQKEANCTCMIATTSPKVDHSSMSGNITSGCKISS